jgi:hypothetical protein
MHVITGKAHVWSNSNPVLHSYSHEVIGAGYFDLERTCLCGDGTVVLYGDGDRVVVSSGTDGVRFLLFSGRPIGEPVAWYGPIVMNTREELRVAFKEYQNGTFIKHGERTTPPVIFRRIVASSFRG